MIRRNQKLINFFNIVSDAGLIFLCYFAALFIRFGLMQGTVHVRNALWHAAVAAGYSLVMVLNVANTGDLATALLAMGVTFLLSNLPTLILLVIYAACREQYRRKKQMERMNIQDLE